MLKLKIIFSFLFVAFLFITNEAQNSNVCSLGAPQNISALDIGPTWITLSWDSISGSHGYELELYENSTYAYTRDTTATTYTFWGLNPGSNYRIVIRSKCSAEDRSSASNYIDITTVVTDLVFSLENPNLNTTPCTQTVGDLRGYPREAWCPLNLNPSGVTYFLAEFIQTSTQKILKVGIKHYVDNYGSNHFEVWEIDNSNNNEESNIYFDLISNWDNEYDKQVKFIKLIEENNYLGKINITYQNGYGLKFELDDKKSFKSLYTINVYNFEQISNDLTNRNIISHVDLKLNNHPSILPNPTTTTLQIQIPTTFTTPVQGTLLNLSGAVVQRYGLEAGVNTVSTANLSPGIYFLRLEGPGYAETFKVVKVE